MHLDFSQMEPVDRYRLMIQSIVPRPIAWTLTENKDGQFNLAPFSYFNAIHSHPPLVMLSIGNKQDRSPKDTRHNIERNGVFIIHIASTEHASLVTASSAALPYGESEVKAHNLELVYDFKTTKLPRLKDCKIAFVCESERLIEVGKNKQGIIFGEIKEVYIDDTIATHHDGKIQIDAMKLAPLARLGGDDYGTLGEVITVPRPEYKPF